MPDELTPYQRVLARRRARTGPPPDTRSMGRKAWDWLNTGVTDLPSRAAKTISEPLYQYGETHKDEYAPIYVPGVGMVPVNLPKAAMVGGAFTEGVGQVTSDMTSPLNLGLMAVTGGASAARGAVARNLPEVEPLAQAAFLAKAADKYNNLGKYAHLKRELDSAREAVARGKALAQTLGTVEAGAGAAMVGQGGYKAVTGKDTSEKGAGVVEAIMGGFGVRGGRSHTKVPTELSPPYTRLAPKPEAPLQNVEPVLDQAPAAGYQTEAGAGRYGIDTAAWEEKLSHDPLYQLVPRRFWPPAPNEIAIDTTLPSPIRDRVLLGERRGEATIPPPSVEPGYPVQDTGVTAGYTGVGRTRGGGPVEEVAKPRRAFVKKRARSQPTGEGTAPSPPPEAPQYDPNRPFQQLSDRDLEVLIKVGEKGALEESAIRKQALGGFEPRTLEDVAPVEHNILGNEVGAVGPNISRYINRSRRMYGTPEEAIPDLARERLGKDVSELTPDEYWGLYKEGMDLVPDEVGGETIDIGPRAGQRMLPGESRALPGMQVRGYHGTAEAFDKFDPARRGSGIGDTSGREGVFITDHPTEASEYAMRVGVERGANVRPVEAELRNPYIVEAEKGTTISERDVDSYIQEAKAAGHDGVIIKDARRGYVGARKNDLTIAFNENQVRSQFEAGGHEPTARAQELLNSPEKMEKFNNLFKRLNNEKGSIPLPQLGPKNFDAPSRIGKATRLHQSVNPTFDRQFADWVNARRATKVEGVLKRKEFADLDAAGMDGIFAFQEGLKAGRFSDVGRYFDDKYKLLEETGVKLGFRENYLPQLWKDPPNVVKEARKRLSLKPQFSMERVLENYRKGIEGGLHPQFETIGELIGWYEQRANKAIADRIFFDHLKETNQLRPADKAPLEWETLSPDVFPVKRFDIGKKAHVTQNYKAPAPIARVINDYLGANRGAFSQALEHFANKATITKNIVLSSGVPMTGINAHGFNILARNVMARGIVRGGAEAAKYLIRPKAAHNWLETNLKAAPEAVRNGLVLTTEEHIFGSTGSAHLLREPKTAVGAKANKAFNYMLSKHGKFFEDPLFQNIVPALKLKHWMEMKGEFVKGGMAPEQAARAAAEAANSLYGGINWEAMQRARDWQNFLRSIILAPDWFETQYRIGKGMANTMLDPRNPRGKIWKRAAANLMGAYVSANVVNYMMTSTENTPGKMMWQNEAGHALDIDLGEVGGKKRWLRPFGTAADFVRLPFDTIVGLKEGDLSAPIKVMKNRLSTVARPLGDLAFNTDPFGNPIFGPDKFGRSQTVPKQLGAAGREVATMVTPQYVMAPINYATGRAGSAEEAILGAVEAPVRYSRVSTRKKSRNRPNRARPSRR